MKSLPNIKYIVAIASGKGGVGKSTTAANLAIAMAQQGLTTGLLDADIYGPSQPLMLGATPPSNIKNQKTFTPVMAHGIQSMSIGYLIDEKTPMVWRGPMVSMALQQLLYQTEWKELDCLIIDLPPGTGDIQLTLAQKIPVNGAVIVSTPQDLALMDAKRAYEMFHKIHIPVLGIIENMSIHVCSKCNHEEPIFGEGGGLSFAQEFGIELLGSLPLDISIRMQTDQGCPTVAAHPHSTLAMRYHNIAKEIMNKLILQTSHALGKFPVIEIKND